MLKKKKVTRAYVRCMVALAFEGNAIDHASVLMARIARMAQSLLKGISDESPTRMNHSSIITSFFHTARRDGKKNEKYQRIRKYDSMRSTPPLPPSIILSRSV